MVEKARVFVAEDDPDLLESLKYVIEKEGHTVTLSAASLSDALAAISTFPQFGIQIASIDGNLRKGEKSGSDGRQMVAAIRNAAPEVKIVGISGQTIPGVDVDLGKDRTEKLGKVITEL